MILIWPRKSARSDCPKKSMLRLARCPRKGDRAKREDYYIKSTMRASRVTYDGRSLLAYHATSPMNANLC